MQGKVCLITGATTGIGKVIAIALAKHGAYIVSIYRDEEKAKELQEIFKTFQGNIALYKGDLSSLKETRKATLQITRDFPQVDLLFNNAGLINKNYEETIDGIETTFQVNHLSSFLLTKIFLQHTKKNHLCVINTSSHAHKRVQTIDWEDIGLKQSYTMWKAYCQSKLFNILFTKELARRYPADKLTATCFHPGFVRSNFGANNSPILQKIIMTVLIPFSVSTQEGARTGIYLALLGKKAKRGEYYFKNKISRVKTLASDKKAANKLWDISTKMLKQEA